MASGQEKYAGRLLFSRFPSRMISSDEEADQYCGDLFARLRAFRFASDRQPTLKTNGMAFEGWRVALVRSSGHEIDLEEDSIALLVPYKGRIEVNLQGDVVAAGNGGLLLVGPGRRKTIVSRGYVGALVQIPHRQAIRMTRPGILGVTRNDPFKGVRSIRGDREVSFAKLLIHRLDCGSERLWSQDGPQLGFEASIQKLLTSVLYPRRSSPFMPGEASLRQVLNAEEVIRARFSEELAAEDVADAVGVSVRALQLAFRRNRDCSPLEFLTRVRLEHVRVRLRTAGRHSITEVALEAGFTHMGRFSAVYHRAFGELPSETARRASQINLLPPATASPATARSS